MHVLVLWYRKAFLVLLSPTYTRRHFAGNTVESSLLLSVCWASTLKATSWQHVASGIERLSIPEATCCLTASPDVESNIVLPVVYVVL